MLFNIDLWITVWQMTGILQKRTTLLTRLDIRIMATPYIQHKMVIVFPITKKKYIISIFFLKCYSIWFVVSRFISFWNYQRRPGSSFSRWTSSSSNLHISYICHKFDRRECTHWSCSRQNSRRRYINILNAFTFI